MSADPSHPLVDLTGQVALVTGGGRGLGRAFAVALAKAGAHVAVTARTAEPLAETVAMVERSGGRALAIPGDVSAPEAVAHVVRTAESQLGPVDILVNNAGAVGPLGYDWEVDLEDWWRTFEINVRGPFLYARAVLPGMVNRQRGRIVNISTGAAFGRLPQMDAYGATKAALTQWTKCLAADIQAYGVTVFAFHPGMVRTPMLDYLTSPDVPNAVQALFHSLLSEGRDVPIERSAQMLLFLVSGKADALAGRFIRALDNEEELVRRAEEIRRDDLHVVTLRT
ncbi:MAG TPA: SDR family oxidoreductase [Methylomirabilota bacterium]|nr:SDR family oxidoreductase [Methylomirabilota bacterium]